ncbi:hypothetical protein ACNOYE_27350 [Nannocystaceae bacterium ST9]
MLPSANGDYPLHDLVMRMVEDDINGETWRLRPLVDKNARKGINNVIKDVGRTDLIAGAGELYLLVDRDRVAEHLGLVPTAPDDDVVTKLAQRSDAPHKLHTYFLRPNLEGLLRDIGRCDPSILPANLEAALRKKLNDRDLVLNEVKKAARADVRNCMRQAQPGLDALVKAIASRLGAELTASQA